MIERVHPVASNLCVFFVFCTFLWSIENAAIAAASARKWRTMVLFCKNLCGERREGWDKLVSVTLLTLFSCRNAIWYWHLGRLTAAAPDLVMRLHLSRHFFSRSFRCFCRNGAKSKWITLSLDYNVKATLLVNFSSKTYYALCYKEFNVIKNISWRV